MGNKRLKRILSLLHLGALNLLGSFFLRDVGALLSLMVDNTGCCAGFRRTF